MKILIIGKKGQLGRSIHKVVSSKQLDDEYIFTSRHNLNLESLNNISKYFNKNHFDIIVNCASYTSVDSCETEIELANKVNNIAVQKIAKISNVKNIKLIHISTDYVFDGKSKKPYLENDQVNPVNIYGKTKLAGEKAIQEIMPRNAIVLRTSWLYSEYGKNFVDTIIKLGKEHEELRIVSDQIGSPTYATDLAEVILLIVRDEKFRKSNQTTQIYHYSNKGYCSWFGFAKQILKIAKIECNVIPVLTKEYPTPAKRPKSTLMNKDKIFKAYSVQTIDWKESLEKCMAVI